MESRAYINIAVSRKLENLEKGGDKAVGRNERVKRMDLCVGRV